MKICHFRSIVKVVCLYLIISCSTCSASKLPDYIPESLQPWRDWVLHGKTESIECVPHFNNPESIQCAFPSSIILNLNSSGGEFTQDWQIYHEGYLPLPGNETNWAHAVMVDDIPTVVVQLRDNYGKIMPSVKLSQGRRSVTGKFIWQKQPEYIQIPPETALIKLMIDNNEVEFPNFDIYGRLWLKTAIVEQKEENRLKIESFRLIDDGIPPQVVIYATLDVAGVAREVKLGPLYSPEKFIPLSLDADVPSKLESDGTIRMQLKSGRHSMTLKLRHVGHLSELTFLPSEDGYWQKQEVWSVVRHPDLRIVEISGVPSIDPKMTSMPESWKSYPAYMILANESMKFKEIKRGDPLPPPDQLNLHRTLWLSFDGTGYTIQDTITGNKNSKWRLEIEPMMQLGKVVVDGVEQLITKMDSSKNSGVELRRGNLNLVADSKVEGSIYKIPATGWIHPFQKVTGTLNLPPGWKLIATKGIDNVSGTWIKRWSLLDIFIVLIFTIATAKLFSFPLAVVGFITLVVLYHEPGAPRYVWIFLIIGFALKQTLCDRLAYDVNNATYLTATTSGKFHNVVKFYQFVILISLLLISVPYAIKSLSVGIYPQLENRWVSMNDALQIQNQQLLGEHQVSEKERRKVQSDKRNITNEEELDILTKGSGVAEQAELPAEALPSSPIDGYNMADEYKKAGKEQLMNIPRKAKGPLDYLMSKEEGFRNQSNNYGKSDSQWTKVMQYDPKSLTQTGPGLPLWQPFRTINFSWSGPVEPAQVVSFTLIGPTVNLLLAFLRVFLIILLTIGMFKAGYGSGFLKGAMSVKKILNGSGNTSEESFKTDSSKEDISIKNEILSLILISLCLCSLIRPSVTNATEIPSPEILAELQNRLLEKDKCFPACADISQIAISIKPVMAKNSDQIQHPNQKPFQSLFESIFQSKSQPPPQSQSQSKSQSQPNSKSQPQSQPKYSEQIEEQKQSQKENQLKKYDQLELILKVDAAVDTVIPLPGHASHWLPEKVIITNSNKESESNIGFDIQSISTNEEYLHENTPPLFRLDQILWVMVPVGKHSITVQGKIGNQSSFQLPFAIKPHLGKIVELVGWEVQGVQPDGTLDDQLQFKRKIIKSRQIAGKIENKDENKNKDKRAVETDEAEEKLSDESQLNQDEESLETGLLPPFALVQRTLLLGLDWKVETTVQRLTPNGSAIVLNLPLLKGESVITEGIRVKNGMVELALNSSQNALSYDSFLETSETVRLYHAFSGGKDQNREWTEIWKLDVSPIFHVETEGIPVILHQSHARWYPTWHPWPGEEVILKITRPQGIDGQTMTIEKSSLELHPGQRATRSTLSLSIKSSQGGQHNISIPKNAELQEVKINGAVQLIRQEGEKVVLPITPGSQNIELVWKEANGISTFYSTPEIDLGMSSVNSAINLHISSDRWTLFVGGEQLMGPAVLFWSKIIVILIVSISLALTGLTPLKFYQWFLLGIGMSMSSAIGCLFVAAWLVVLDKRSNWGKELTPTKFNLMQLGIVFLTLFAICLILMAISQGLLGHPSMNIIGNGSTARLLKWYQDTSDSTLPIAWLFSLPMFAYRLAMLIWALWLSFWLLSIIKWGWSNFTTPTIRKK